MNSTKSGTPEPLVQVADLKKHFLMGTGFLRSRLRVRAVDGVSFDIARGETLGLVGESGCGKSTVGRVVIRLVEPTNGTVRISGKDISQLDNTGMRAVRKTVQIIFQDPYSSLNPRMTAGRIVGEPLQLYGLAKGEELADRVSALFERVGLSPDRVHDYPHEFSGGQRQRLGIARALALQPELIVCDEPVSALDMSIQAQVVNLLMDLQNEYGLSYLFIAHDLAVVQHVSHRIAVMYLGRIVELTDKRTLFRSPAHPYTEALLAAVPVPDPRNKPTKRIILGGDVPSPISPPPGCHFHPRCPYAMERCKVEIPTLREVAPGHIVSCHLHDGTNARAAERRAGDLTRSSQPGIQS